MDVVQRSQRHPSAETKRDKQGEAFHGNCLGGLNEWCVW
jgi:hypothetical protein